jgi:hypothetical protein
MISKLLSLIQSLQLMSQDKSDRLPLNAWRSAQCRRTGLTDFQAGTGIPRVRMTRVVLLRCCQQMEDDEARWPEQVINLVLAVEISLHRIDYLVVHQLSSVYRSAKSG